jgi:hypothetical protein
MRDSKTANLIVTHQSADCVARMLDYWRGFVPEESLWIAYGGKKEEFERVAHPRKYFLESNRIRVKDIQRDRQGYHEIFQAAVANGVLDGRDYLHLVEFDQLPIQQNLNQLQIQHLEADHADVLTYGLRRVDGTHYPHYLAHIADGRLDEFLHSISLRPDPGVVLSCYGFGTFWRAEAFRLVAAVPEPFPIYLELFMPTVAHHLGCRVRRVPHPERFTLTLGVVEHLHEEAIAAGAWFIHPVKQKWNITTISS